MVAPETSEFLSQKMNSFYGDQSLRVLCYTIEKEF